MKFPSAKDVWLGIVFWGCILVCIGSAIVAFINEKPGLWEGLLLLVLLVILPAFLIWLWFSTYYILEEKVLIIKSGPIKKRVPLDTIRSLRKTSNPLSSPALSMKRIEIMYGKYHMALISPKDRDEFLKILKERCPNAVLK